jgi:hypothetical protein
MRFGALKNTISDSEKTFIAALGLFLLLIGLAELSKHKEVNDFTALAILVGLFAVCLVAVKQRRLRQ